MKKYGAFAIKSMEPVLLSLEKRYGIFITIHDFRGYLLRSDNGNVVDFSHHIHRHLCARLRKQQPANDKICYQECCLETQGHLKEKIHSFEKICRFGFSELVVPIVQENQLKLTLLVGLFRSKDAPPSSPAWLRKEYKLLPEGTPELFEELTPLLTCVGLGMLAYAEQSGFEPRIKNRRTDQIKKFMRDNLHRDISLGDLAKYLYLSPSHTSSLLRKEFGKTFPALLTETRIERAKKLLTETDLPIQEIADSLGFANVFYFGRVFAEKENVPPGRFRKKNRKYAR